MFIDPKFALDYILSGNAVVSIKSLKTGLYLRYRVFKKGGIWFVNVLKDESLYVGMIRDKLLWRSKASQFAVTEPEFNAFDWTLKHLYNNHIPAMLEIRHDGTCGRCGRPLSTPDSVDRGIGPECYKALHP